MNGHRTRISMDASTYDEICVKCGATDGLMTMGGLAQPCPVSDEDYERRTMRTTTLFLAIELRADASESRIREAAFADLARQLALNRRVPLTTTEDHQPVYVIHSQTIDDPERQATDLQRTIAGLRAELQTAQEVAVRSAQEIARLARVIDAHAEQSAALIDRLRHEQNL